MAGRDEGYVWIFHGEGGQFASAVFSSVDAAERWIDEHRLTGLLTAYPVDQSVYDWAVERGFVKPGFTPTRIARFSSAHTGHFHYDAGVRTAGSRCDANRDAAACRARRQRRRESGRPS